jgi:hypothetical protein
MIDISAPGYWLTAAGHEGGLSGVKWVGEGDRVA